MNKNNMVKYGEVLLGRDCSIQDNVILGNSESGRLTIGDNALIRSGCIIYSDTRIGNRLRTGHNVLIRENCDIGNNVLVGTNSILDGNCRIGNNVAIQTDVYITAGTIIEDDAFIGPRVCTTNDKYMFYGARLAAPIIKKGARIGGNSTILPGVVIGEGSIVGAATVVTKDVPPGITVVGNPAKPISRQKVKDMETVNRANDDEKSRILKIVVIGMGYVGIPAAVLLANAGHDVTGIQRRSKRSGWKIDWLNQGRCPIGGSEPLLPEMIEKVVKSKRFRVTDDYSAVKTADMILIDVQTPTDNNHVPRYESLTEVCHIIGKLIHPRQVVIIESTVAPGTTEYLVKPILEEESHLKAGLPDGFGLCFSYERVMVGRLIHNIQVYPKIVGGIDEKSTQAAVKMYNTIVNGGVNGTDIMTAEISKTVENAYRDVQIAFSNEIALLCESLGVDVYEVRKFVNGLPNDPSVPYANPVRNMHFPGAGVGGHCLPKDTWLLIHGYNQYARSKIRYPHSLLADARYLNDWMPMHMVDLLESALEEAGRNIKEAKVCVLGYAFLENSDDARNTPTVPLLQELERRGARFVVHDPLIKEAEEGYPITQDIETALTGSDAIVLMTKHDGYGIITPEKLKDLMKAQIIIDGRNLFDPIKFTKAGFIIKGVGKGNIGKQ